MAAAHEGRGRLDRVVALDGATLCEMASEPNQIFGDVRPRAEEIAAQPAPSRTP